MSTGTTGPLAGGSEPPEPPDHDALHRLCLADPVWRERYEGWTELGRGATAIVVRTRSRALGEDVALKVFPAPFSQDPKRFQDEVRNAQRLASPYIVRIYSPFPRGSLAWIEMELVEGVTLRQELEARQAEGRGFALGEALAVGEAVAEALSAAHLSGVVHRDVKPANLLLPRSGSPVAKLGDFGVSRVDGAAALTRTGVLVGTPQFAAPEVIDGRPSGPASDVYSFGHCLYLMLSGGRFPFALQEGASPLHWMRAHAEQAPLPVRVHNPRVPPALEGLLSAMLAKDPERRPRAAEVAACLSALRAGADPPPLRDAGRGPRIGRFVWAGTGTALALGAVVAWVALAPRRPPAAAGPAPPATLPAAIPAGASPALPALAPPSASPARPAPLPSAATPAAAVAPPLPVSASIRGELVGLRNTGAEHLPSLQIALIYGPPPVRVEARHPEGLAPGEELWLALDSFEPAPPGEARPSAIEVMAGARTRRWPLP